LEQRRLAWKTLMLLLGASSSIPPLLLGAQLFDTQQSGEGKAFPKK